MVACRVGEPGCVDESLDSEGPFCFIYSIVFRRVGLRLPFTRFERALLTEVNVSLAQLHPNSWAFVRAFPILCHCLGHTPSVDAFLFFFEAKSPDKKLWVSFNSVAGRVLLTLFQQSYKGFKKHFFKVRCNRRDPALLLGGEAKPQEAQVSRGPSPSGAGSMRAPLRTPYPIQYIGAAQT